MKRFENLVAFTALAIAPTGASAAEYYLATDGSDSATGDIDAPWGTFAHALTQVSPGDGINVRAGSYAECVLVNQSGSEGAYITIRAHDGETVVIDGSEIIVSGRMGLVELQDCSYVRIEGLTVRNLSTSNRDQTPVGILYEGSGTGVELVNNTVEQIATLANPRANGSGRDAHGIGVFGTDAIAISELLVLGNIVRDLTLGSSEALVINGNVDGFRIIENSVSNCDNIGIDCIGYEGVGPTDALDQARNGWISGNCVSGVSTVGNPSYNGPCSAGIYVDGGRDIVIERNQVSLCDIGVEVASEHLGKSTSNVIVRSNLLTECLMAGLFIGGYESGSTGSAANCVITHNTFYNNDTQANGDEFGQLHIQYQVIDTEITANIFYHDITKSGECNIFIVQWNNDAVGLVINRNLYYGPETPVWVLGGDWTEGWPTYDNLALSRAEEVFAAPGFIGAASGDFRLTTGSPAIDLGSTSEVSGVRDLDGLERTVGESPDAGAYEFGAEASTWGGASIEANDQEAYFSMMANPGRVCGLQYSKNFQEWLLTSGVFFVQYDLIWRATLAGMQGDWSKSVEISDTLNAIIGVAAHEHYLPPELEKSFMTSMRQEL
ncbi:choice-of-anchor Q domain-containing protein [Cerasicoccus maritimus]|uniref:choice-of-anchor Q domain-containing protein n=1 Tax=Cerasicoccus maritimus TaxID=490089 RepID=UPI00285297DA|nr:choice-of-anchor Q domain-containing protein [Cerasicoccus maritimus]